MKLQSAVLRIRCPAVSRERTSTISVGEMRTEAKCLHEPLPFWPLPDTELLPCVPSECLLFFVACLPPWACGQ